MFDIVTIGGATRDIFFITDRDWVIKNHDDPTKNTLMCFEYGAKVIPKEVHFSFGGGAVNTAISFSRLGQKTASLISLGNDEIAEVILKNLKKEGVHVNTKLAKTRGVQRTGISVIIVDKKGDHTAILYRGTNNFLNIKNWDWLKESKWAYISSLTGESEKFLNSFLYKLEKGKFLTKIAWNPGSCQLQKGYAGLKRFLKITNVLILNRDEAIELALSKNKKIDINDIDQIIFELQESGPRIVVVTDGKNGAYACDGNDLYFTPSVKVKIVDTTGAGDAFGSSFIAGLNIYKNSIRESLVLASINAASVVTHFSSQTGLKKKRDIIGEVNKIKSKVKRLKLCRN